MNPRSLHLATFLILLNIAVLFAENPWVALTRLDLQGIHDVLQENHPGPVDSRNPRYAQWLKEGLEKGNQLAASAISFSDYVRALQYYTNGFQDGHIGIGLEVHPDRIAWPGFIVERTSKGAEVISAENGSGISKGSQILSCDGQSLNVLMARRIDPYYWNTAIPQDRFRHVDQLFYQDRLDSRSRFKTCKFSSGDIDLRWRSEETAAFLRRLEEVREGGVQESEIKRVNGVWLIRLPTFAYSTDEQVKKIRALILDLKTLAPELRNSTVIIDVRGNHGGDSAWGEEVAAALWGKDWVDRITSSFDNTVDWRVSPSNLKFIEAMMERERSAGLNEQVQYLTKVRDAMKSAIESGHTMARIEDRPKPRIGTAPQNPAKGQIYFFTDNACASACLDFADLMIRLPGVQHVGLPTSADAIYIDNTYTVLPSGLAGIGYSMKVFRNRVRKNNEWYEPQIRWPGGPMTDDSITKWISSLH